MVWWQPAREVKKKRAQKKKRSMPYNSSSFLAWNIEFSVPLLLSLCWLVYEVSCVVYTAGIDAR